MTTNDDQNTGKLPSKISRRTLAAGAAWSVPVIAVASAAPAYALSGALSLVQTGACKSPGGSCNTFKFGYLFYFTASNSYGCDIDVTDVTYVITSGDAPGPLTFPDFTVPMGTTTGFTVRANGTNSAQVNFTATLTLSYEDCDGNPQTVDVYVTIAGTPPDCPCI